MNSRTIAQGLAAIVLTWMAAGAIAQQPAWPARPVTLIVPTAPGSVSENEGRIHMARLAENLHQSFIMDFKAGAAGIIGLTYVARSAPDGYTLLLTSASFSTLPLRDVNLTFDGINAFTPVSLISKRWGVMAVHPSMPGNPAEFVAYAKANPGKINYGTSGVGSLQHLTGAWMASVTGIDMTFIHYKGSNPAQLDLVAGRIQITPITLTSVAQYLKTGKMKALGLANLTRNPAMPDMPALTEAGWKDFEYSSWLGVLAPVKTPANVVRLLSSELTKVVKSPDVVKRLEAQTQLIGSTPEEFGRHINTETERWRKLMKETGIKLAEED